MPVSHSQPAMRRDRDAGVVRLGGRRFLTSGAGSFESRIGALVPSNAEPGEAATSGSQRYASARAPVTGAGRKIGHFGR
jgi:hypothetical protein